MEKFTVTILGCGAASPTSNLHTSSQIVTYGSKCFLVDCGEGTQMQMRRSRIGFNKIKSIFISHLHGDHCFGLPGLLSSMGMLDRREALTVYSPKGLREALMPLFKASCHDFTFDLNFITFNDRKPLLLYEDNTLTVTTIPLTHRGTTCGFLFEEKMGKLHLRGDALTYYNVPVYWRERIKQGEDYVAEDGTVIPNSRLTAPPTPPRRYAYCSDTAYDEDIIKQIAGVNLLYHEATYLQSDLLNAKRYGHSTAMQAADIAQKSGAGELLLGHFSAKYRELGSFHKEAQSIFPASQIAKETQTYNVGI